MKQDTGRGESPSVHHPIEWEARSLLSVLGGAAGAALAVLFGASLLKRSTIGFAMVALTGYLLGWAMGALAATFSRHQLPLQRIIVRVVKWIIASIGIVSLVLAISYLYDSIYNHDPTLLFASSFCGAAGLIMLKGSDLLAAGYGLVVLGFFATLALVAGAYTRDTMSLAVSLCWNAAVAFALVVAWKRPSSSFSSQPTLSSDR